MVGRESRGMEERERVRWKGEGSQQLRRMLIQIELGTKCSDRCRSRWELGGK